MSVADPSPRGEGVGVVAQQEAPSWAGRIAGRARERGRKPLVCATTNALHLEWPRILKAIRSYLIHNNVDLAGLRECRLQDRDVTKDTDEQANGDAGQ